MKIDDIGWLKQKFEKENLPKTEIAEIAGCNRKTVYRRIAEFDLERDWKKKSVLYDLYWNEGLSTREMADRLNTGSSPVRRQLKEHGIPTRTSNREKPPSFGLHPDGREYEVIRHNGHMVYVHRLCAVAWEGLEAVIDRSVHHRNNIGWDNRESNIQTLTRSEHAKIHAN